MCQVLLFIHAMSGCDTTFALYRQSKEKTFKLLMQNDELHKVAAVFNNSASSHDDVAKAGETFLLALYGFNTSYCLDRLRYFILHTAQKLRIIIFKQSLTLQVFRHLLQPPDNSRSVYSIRYNSG